MQPLETRLPITRINHVVRRVQIHSPSSSALTLVIYNKQFFDLNLVVAYSRSYKKLITLPESDPSKAVLKFPMIFTVQINR